MGASGAAAPNGSLTSPAACIGGRIYMFASVGRRGFGFDMTSMYVYDRDVYAAPGGGELIQDGARSPGLRRGNGWVCGGMMGLRRRGRARARARANARCWTSRQAKSRVSAMKVCAGTPQIHLMRAPRAPPRRWARGRPRGGARLRAGARRAHAGAGRRPLLLGACSASPITLSIPISVSTYFLRATRPRAELCKERPTWLLSGSTWLR